MLSRALAHRQLLGQAQLGCSSRVSLSACALAALLLPANPLQRGFNLLKPAQVCRAEWFVSVHWCQESFILHPSNCFPLLKVSWIGSAEQRKVSVCKKSLVLVWCWFLPCWCLRKEQWSGVVVCWEEGMCFTFIMLYLFFDKVKLWSRYRITEAFRVENSLKTIESTHVL